MPGRCLIIGFGSIGRRHDTILRRMGYSTVVMSTHGEGKNIYHDLEKAYKAESFDYAVIANRTRDHRNTLERLANFGYTGRILVEKPVFDRRPEVKFYERPSTFVGYQLRFDPVIQNLRKACTGNKILSIQAYVGQYLPDWRPGSDYRESYSAARSAGGGVLRDLSHELDYITWIAGPWKRVCALGGKFSPLEIDSDDAFGLLLETESCPLVSLQMNYLDRKSRREIIVNLEDRTVGGDLVEHALFVDKEKIHYPIQRDAAFEEMHRRILETETHLDVCTLREGLETLDLIEAAERSIEQRGWVWR